MITLRPTEQRGRTRIDWLDSRHTFSFGEYFDPAHMGFRALRVINEDKVAPGAGFPTHGHRDMEIISYVLDGALEHKDSIGTGSRIQAGEVQRMSAGTGIRHSEYNASPKAPVHFLQIWILPERQDLAAGYEQKTFGLNSEPGRLQLVGSRDGRDGSITIHQDVNMYAGVLKEGQTISYTPPSGRYTWIQVARGGVTVNGTPMRQGDGLAAADEAQLALTADEDAEVIVFDLA